MIEINVNMLHELIEFFNGPNNVNRLDYVVGDGRPGTEYSVSAYRVKEEIRIDIKRIK